MTGHSMWSGRTLRSHEWARERLDSCAGDHGIGCLGNVSLPFCERDSRGGCCWVERLVCGGFFRYRHHRETRERVERWQRGRKVADRSHNIVFLFFEGKTRLCNIFLFCGGKPGNFVVLGRGCCQRDSDASCGCGCCPLVLYVRV